MTLLRDSRTRLAVPNPLRFVVRNGVPADADELSRFWGEVKRFTYSRTLRRYFEEVERGVQFSHVAEYEGKLVGQFWTRFTGIDPSIADSRTECYLHTLQVLRPYRRRGIARALTEAASDEARRRGREFLVIGVDRPNIYALSLYEKWGFVAFHQTSDLRGDLIFLRRRVF